jgi:hypothetical protein
MVVVGEDKNNAQKTTSLAFRFLDENNVRKLK